MYTSSTMNEFEKTETMQKADPAIITWLYGEACLSQQKKGCEVGGRGGDGGGWWR